VIYFDNLAAAEVDADTDLVWAEEEEWHPLATHP